MIRAGVIGYGYWGPKVARNLAENSDCDLVAVGDASAERLAAAELHHRGVRTTTHSRELIQDPAIDAIAVCTPVSTHCELAIEALRSGKHVLVEKPMAASSEEANRMIEEAARQKRVLMVDHTFVYTSAVRKIREVIHGEDFGEVYYYDSVRVNLGLFRRDVNVVWDLAVHDFSILDYLLPNGPCAVSATGLGHVPGRDEDIAYITAFFESGMIGHITVNWLAPLKVRQTLIGGSRKMIVYNDIDPSEKIRIYDRGITLHSGAGLEGTYDLQVGYRLGDMWAPWVDRTEALRREVAHFADCIQTGAPAETGGEAGLRVVRLLEGATESLSMQGRPVQLVGGRQCV